MIKITGTTVAATAMLDNTTIGTCNYSARKFEATGEFLHEVTAINGIQLQWITETISLATLIEDATNKIAELRPLPEPNPEITEEEKAQMLNW